MARCDRCGKSIDRIELVYSRSGGFDVYKIDGVFYVSSGTAVLYKTKKLEDAEDWMDEFVKAHR
jgi:hypothetical protein